jgi:hypothetical protein
MCSSKIIDALQREMIIPRSPTPDPDNIDNLPTEELQRLARERLAQIKV